MNPKITFLTGINGSGKSRRLAELANHPNSKSRIIAISNTPHDKFPKEKKDGKLKKINVARGSAHIRDILKRIMINKKLFHKREAIGRILEYIGYEPKFGISIKPIREENPHKIYEEILKITPHAIKIPIYKDRYQRDIFIENRNIYWASLANKTETIFEYDAIQEIISISKSIRNIVPALTLEFHLEKHGKKINFNDISSGELSLLATHAFIASNINPGSYILIDEPENSLHPKWQSEYCENLFNLHYLYEPIVTIATHSPIIISGASANKIETNLIDMEGKQSTYLQGSNVESILIDTFKTITPQSRKLSEIISDLLRQLSDRKKSLKETINEIESLKIMSYDEIQIEFLNSSIILAKKINSSLKEK